MILIDKFYILIILNIILFLALFISYVFIFHIIKNINNEIYKIKTDVKDTNTNIVKLHTIYESEHLELLQKLLKILERR